MKRYPLYSIEWLNKGENMDDQFWSGVVTGIGTAAVLAMLLTPWLRSRTASSRMIAPWAFWSIFGLIAGLGFGYWLPGILATIFASLLVGMLVGAVARDYGQARDFVAVLLGGGAALGVTIGYLGSLWLHPMLTAAIMIALTVVAISYRRPLKKDEVKTPEAPAS